MLLENPMNLGNTTNYLSFLFDYDFLTDTFGNGIFLKKGEFYFIQSVDSNYLIMLGGNHNNQKKGSYSLCKKENT